MSHSQLQVPAGQYGRSSQDFGHSSQGFGSPLPVMTVTITDNPSPFGDPCSRPHVTLPNINRLLPASKTATNEYNQWYHCIMELLSEKEELKKQIAASPPRTVPSPLPSDESKNLAKIAKQKATIKKLNSIIALLLNSESDEE